MRFGDWIIKEGLTLGAAAKIIGVSNATVVRRYAVLGRTPTPEIMERIFHATKGAVTPNDFYDFSQRTKYGARARQRTVRGVSGTT